jgi:hypothetical protein
VRTFANARDAKEFLVSRIIMESLREGVSLSDVERKMLYFSETAWTLPDMAEVKRHLRSWVQPSGIWRKNRKKLIRNMRTSDPAPDREECGAWNEALRTIRKEDHYLLVLIAAAESPNLSARRFLKLTAIALVVAWVIVAVADLVMNR